MTRTIKAAKSPRDGAEPLADTQPVYFVDPRPAAAEPSVEPEPEPEPGAEVGRLRGMLDRAGDPVQRPARGSGEARREHGGSRVLWRNDPHVLGRIAAALVVLVLVAACAAVGVHVLG